MESSGASPAGGLLPAAVPDIAAVFDAPGPFVTVYLGTEPAVEQAAQQSELRWKALRRELAEAGAPDTALAAVDPLVADAHTQGRTLAVVANATGALLVRHEPEPPSRDLGRFAGLPSVGPLLEWAQASVPHVVVLADRAGADIVAFTRDGEGRVTTAGQPSGDDPELRKSQPGGWSQRRYQNRAENLWDRNARAVADQVTAVVDEIGARLVVVAGDVRAVPAMREHLPERVAGCLREVDGARSPDGSIDEIADDVVKLVATVAAAETVDLLGTFKQEQGQNDLAAEGVAATIAALAAARVDTLLVHDDPDDGRTAWFGPEPGMVAEDAQTVRDLGAGEPAEGRLVDVAIRAAFTTGAAVRVVPSVRSVAEGIGAVLRF
jgi:Bacterial archaeo-eukaryotic release factor family 2